MPGAAAEKAPPADPPPFDLRLAMILVLFTYGGWNEMAYVAAEVRNPTRNILRALVLGTLAVTAIYVLATVAFVRGLGFAGVQKSEVVAADLLRISMGDFGSKLIALIICISALGSVNGQIFTGARVYYAMGRDHRVFKILGSWDPQAEHAGVVAPGSGGDHPGSGGRFRMVSGRIQQSAQFHDPGFLDVFLSRGVVAVCSACEVSGCAASLPDAVFPSDNLFIFCSSCLFMIYSSVTYAIQHRTYEALWAIGVLVVGMLVAAVSALRQPRLAATEEPTKGEITRQP
ncbi:MAG: hypothetical protein KatS3mg112_0401 [Thermogutta sp.]|nr:MAG: hypothetical protein KatS3mg112_0401 [Thermogutta sp.]